MGFTEVLPTFNACLNATSCVLLVLGYRAVQQRQKRGFDRLAAGRPDVGRQGAGAEELHRRVGFEDQHRSVGRQGEVDTEVV